MLHWNTSSQNAHVMGLHVSWLMALDFLGVWIDHAFILFIRFQVKKDFVSYFAYNCASFPCNCGLCIKKKYADTFILFGRSWLLIHLQQESVAAACGSHAAAGLRVIRMPRAWTWSRIDIPGRLPWTLWWRSTRIHSECREEQDKNLQQSKKTFLHKG